MKLFLGIDSSAYTTSLALVNEQDQGLCVERIMLKVYVMLCNHDLNSGQLVDRVGVAMGLDFPAGEAMEEVCRTSPVLPDKIRIPSAVKTDGFSFSGAQQDAWERKHG